MSDNQCPFCHGERMVNVRQTGYVPLYILCSYPIHDEKESGTDD